MLLFGLFLFMGTNQSSFDQTKTVPLSEVISQTKMGKVTEIDVLDNKLLVKVNGETVAAFKEQGASVYQLFKDAGVALDKTKVVVKDQTGLNSWVNILSSFLPIVLMVAFFYFLFRQARGAQENIFSLRNIRTP